MTPDTPGNKTQRFLKALREAGAGMTQEQCEAWKAEIDRARHPELYCERCRAALSADTPSEPPMASRKEDHQPAPKSQT